MLEVIKNILVSPLNSPLLLVVAIAYMLVESIRIYDARLIQGHTRDFKSGVFQRAEGRQLPFWVGYFHIFAWALFIVMLFLNWKFAIAYFSLLFVLRVLPVLENIGELLMRGFIRQNNDTSIDNVLTIKTAYDILDIILDSTMDKSARENHNIFAYSGYSEFTVSQAMKLVLANEFLQLSNIFSTKDEIEESFSNSIVDSELNYLNILGDFISDDIINQLSGLKFDSPEYRQALNDIRHTLDRFSEKTHFDNDAFESITSFGRYCISIGTHDPNFWDKIHNRIGLSYTLIHPSGNEPFYDL